MASKQKVRLNASSLRLMRRLLKEGVMPYAKQVVLAVLAMMIVAGTTSLLAWLMRPMVDDVFTNRNAGMLWPVAGAVIATSLIKGMATYAQSNILAWVGMRIIADMQNRLFAHLMTMDLKFFHDGSTGKLVSRFTNDINQMRGAVSNSLTSLGKEFLSVIFLIAVMFANDWMLSLIALVVFPLAIQPIVRLGRRMRKVTANTQEQLGQFTTLLEQSFLGIRVVKAYGMEATEKSKIADITEVIFRLTHKANRVRSASSPIMETLGGLSVAAVILYGGSRVIDGTTTTGAFFSFMTALLMAYQPFKNLANLNSNLQEGLAAAERLFDLLDTHPEITSPDQAPVLICRGGAVCFDQVQFSYDGSRPALDGLTLEIPAGKKVALVGASGGGKSTVLNLIPRFYDVQGGAVRIDGQDVRSVSLSSLRGSLSLVSQEVSLFDDTVRANIAYGRAGASEADIIAAAKAAAAHDFISALPLGYDTVVGEHGVKLSGGQRQRLSIARAMLRNAPILLLDEATSALDTESERQVQAALDVLMQGRTTLVVAHRLSTIADADIIHVIDRGRVAESGSHEALIARNGLYARLHALQFAEEAERRVEDGLALPAGSAPVIALA